METRDVAVLPPTHLLVVEDIPGVPEGVPTTHRTEALVGAYAARGDALSRANARFERLQEWVDEIVRLYPRPLQE